MRNSKEESTREVIEKTINQRTGDAKTFFAIWETGMGVALGFSILLFGYVMIDGYRNYKGP
jgi:hypothetical protein